MRQLSTIVLVFGLTIITQLIAQSEAKFSPRLQAELQTVTATSNVISWIYFTDKGSRIDAKLERAEANLTPRAYQRRLRNRGENNLVDRYDIPVNTAYVREIKTRVERIRHQSRWLNAVSVEANESQLNEIASLSFVNKLDLVIRGKRPDPEVVENVNLPQTGEATYSLDYGPSLTQNSQINVPQLHDMGYNGSGVLVAMLDAGFNNLQHEALDHLNILHTWDFVNGDSIVSDQPGQMGTGNHGTYTLSALAGFHETDLIGPAYGADFILAKTENTDWERNIEEDHWVAGAEWADSLGADIISSSLGYRNFDPGQISYTWQDMDGNTTVVTIGADIAASRGILVVNSAGNSGSATPPQNTLVAPSDGDSVVAVGAVDASGFRAGFSSMGPTADGRIKPDVMAMGVFTYCASAFSPNGYANVSGTSLSCPLAAGAAALILEINPNLTNYEIIQALRGTADNAANPNNSLGWGIIDTYAAAFNFTAVSDKPLTVPDKLTLHPAYPNPFNPRTTIRYSLPSQTQVSLSIYNLLGQKMITLLDKQQSAGEHQLVWEASELPSGVYYVALNASGQQEVQRVVLLK